MLACDLQRQLADLRGMVGRKVLALTDGGEGGWVATVCVGAQAGGGIVQQASRGALPIETLHPHPYQVVAVQALQVFALGVNPRLRMVKGAVRHAVAR